LAFIPERWERFTVHWHKRERFAFTRQQFLNWIIGRRFAVVLIRGFFTVRGL
jgi:hypothetical protein